jgi:hypothetical protein
MAFVETSPAGKAPVVVLVSAVRGHRPRQPVHQDGPLMSGVEQHIEGTVRELQQVDRCIGLIPVQFCSDVDNDVPR